MSDALAPTPRTRGFRSLTMPSGELWRGPWSVVSTDADRSHLIGFSHDVRGTFVPVTAVMAANDPIT